MNDEPDGLEQVVYLTFDDSLEIFAAISGGTAAEAVSQLRSRDALEGALARPASYARYEQPDLPLQAAVLAHGIAETQPFIDGNKRVALIAMLTFLEINGRRLVAADRELADWIIDFSRGASPQQIAERIRSRFGS